MKDNASPEPVIPAVAHVGTIVSSIPRPASPFPRSRARLFLTPLSYLWRRPWRALAVLALLTLIGLGIAIAGLSLWTDYHLRAAREAVGRGHNAVAVRHLGACRRFRPNHPEVLLLSARVARRSGAWTEAEELLDQSWRLYGEDDALVLERLLLKATRGEVEAVQPLLQARIDRDDPAAPLAREALVAGLLYRFLLDDAAKSLERWLQHDPDCPTAWLMQGKLDEQREQFSGALQGYRQALKLDPEHDEARLRMTTILLQLSQGEEALTHLTYLRRSLPENPEVRVQLARALDLQGRIEEACAALDECLRDHPDYPAALAERGRIALRDKDTRAAEGYLARAVRLDPAQRSARYQYYLALDHNNKKAEAAAELEATHRLDADLQRINELVRERLPRAPNDPAIQYEVAMIALRAGQPREALRWLLNTLQADPNHAPAHRALAAFYYETGSPILSARHRALAQQRGGKQQP